MTTKQELDVLIYNVKQRLADYDLERRLLEARRLELMTIKDELEKMVEKCTE